MTDAPRTIRLGTRSSDLALTQSSWVADLLRERGLRVELVPITTRGDRSRRPLALMGGVGVFAAALRTALLEGECDLAVHSLKDLPVAPVPGLTIAAVPGREDIADVLVLAPHLASQLRSLHSDDGDALLAQLPDGLRIGTGSPRRAAQIRALLPTCQIADIRGNVPTRIARAAAGDLDAVVLAAAGLNRLGDTLAELLAERLVVPLPILPAAAQGALAVECRSADAAGSSVFGSALAEALTAIDDAGARAVIDAERAVLAELEAGCAAPVGTHGELLASGDLALTAAVFALDGSETVSATTTGHPWDAIAIGRDLARELLAQGAGDIAEIGARHTRARSDAVPALAPTTAGPEAGPLAGRTVFVPREADDHIVAELRAAGAAVIAHPVTLTEPIDVDAAALAANLLPSLTHLAITSPRTITRLEELNLLETIRATATPPEAASLASTSGASPAAGRAPLVIAAVGPASAAAAEAAGLPVTIRGTHDAATLAAAMIAAAQSPEPSEPAEPPEASAPGELAEPAAAPHAWLPASALAAPTLADALTAAGWRVTRTPIYTTRTRPSADQDVADAWHRGLIDAVVVTAPSVAAALVELFGHAGPGTAVVAIGEPTARAIRAGGGLLAATAAQPTPAAICAAVVNALRPDGERTGEPAHAEAPARTANPETNATPPEPKEQP